VDEAVKNYDYSQTLDIPIEELTGVEDQMPSDGIRSIPEMADYIKNFHSNNLFDFDKRKKPYSEIVDQELQFIDQLLDDQIINSFIAPDGYLPIDKNGADLLFQIISQRYETGAMIITTNRVFKEWPQIFNNDSTLTSALLDRLLHHTEAVVIEGDSYRMRQVKK
jgi:hypothetical protein